MSNKLKLGFLASGGGSNVQAIIDSIKSSKLYAEACVIISNNSNAGVFERAKKKNIPHYHISNKTNPENTTKAIINALKKHDVNMVILAGYMKKIEPELIDAFDGKVLNIHPALLPKFGGKGMYGMNVHKAVLEAGEAFSGATVHLVNKKYDEGRILQQKKVPVLPDDTPESLAERVLQAEHFIYSDTLKKIESGEIKI